MKIIPGICLLLVLLLSIYQHHTCAQSTGNNRKKTKLYIHVSGGKADSLIRGADIYLESEESIKSFDEKTSMTNNKGIGTFSNVPQGKVSIRITAEGWKTYGGNYTLDSSKKDINILLQPSNKP